MRVKKKINNACLFIQNDYCLTQERNGPVTRFKPMKKTHTTITVPVAVSELVRPVAFSVRESNSKFFTKAGEARARKLLKLDKLKGSK